GDRLDMATATPATIHGRGYHDGHRAVACMVIGASRAPTQATRGPTHGAMPRRPPRARLPAAVAASSTDEAARKIGISQISQSEALTPLAGYWMPRARSRSRNGPSTAIGVTTAIQSIRGDRRPRR